MFYCRKNTTTTTPTRRQDKTRQLYYINLRSKTNALLPTRICKCTNTISTKESIAGEWERGNFLVFSKGHLPKLPCEGVHLLRHPRKRYVFYFFHLYFIYFCFEPGGSCCHALTPSPALISSFIILPRVLFRIL